VGIGALAFGDPMGGAGLLGGVAILAGIALSAFPDGPAFSTFGVRRTRC